MPRPPRTQKKFHLDFTFNPRRKEPSSTTPTIMPAPTTTLLIEGSFSELAEEFAQYVDSLSPDQPGALQADLAPLLQPLREQEQNEQETEVTQRDEVLKKLVAAAAVLNAAPEKGAWRTSLCG